MTNNIGWTLYVAEAAPASNTAAGFEALTWVKANGIQSVGSLAITHALIDIPDLQTGFTTAVKGAAAGTDVPLVFRTVASDAGQADIKGLAEAKSGVGSIKLVKGSGANEAPATGDPVVYAQGVFHSYAENPRDTNSYDGFSAQFHTNAVAIIATEPA